MSSNYYIFKSGQIKRRDNSFIFYYKENNEKKIKYIPINDITSIYFFGEISFNSKFINFIGQNNLLLHFFNYYGFYTGTFYPKENLLSGFLLIKQAKFYIDNNKRLYLSRNIIQGGVNVMLYNLKYYKNRGKALDEYIEKIQLLYKKINSSKSIDELMGIEGNIREVYYKSFNSIIKKNINFEKRIKHPPDNIINTLISFLNSLVYTICVNEIYKTQLNPTISFIHQPGEKRLSLSLDISEIFKPLIADKIIFSILNKQEINENDFEKHSNFLFIKDKARKLILKKFDEKIKTTIYHKKLKRKISYRYIIRLELYKIIKHIIGETEYLPFSIWW